MKQVIGIIAWLSVLFASFSPSLAMADTSFVLQEDPEARTRAAYILAGLTVIAIAGGIAALATASGHHHHRSSSGSSYDSYDSYSSSSYSSDHHHHHNDQHHNDHHHDNHHHSRHGKYFSSYSYTVLDENNVSSWRGKRSDDVSEEFRDGRNRGVIGKKLYTGKKASDEKEVTGSLIANPGFAPLEQGNLSAFVQLPDGTTEVLGTIPLSGSSSSPLSYGPFDQKGTYTFGVCLEQGTKLPTQTKIGSIEVNIDGSTTQRHDFIAPPHAPANFEPAPFCFNMN